MSGEKIMLHCMFDIFFNMKYLVTISQSIAMIAIAFANTDSDQGTIGACPARLGLPNCYQNNLYEVYRMSSPKKTLVQNSLRQLLSCAVFFFYFPLDFNLSFELILTGHFWIVVYSISRQ